MILGMAIIISENEELNWTGVINLRKNCLTLLQIIFLVKNSSNIRVKPPVDDYSYSNRRLQHGLRINQRFDASIGRVGKTKQKICRSNLIWNLYFHSSTN
jgi:hypothetical protein